MSPKDTILEKKRYSLLPNPEQNAPAAFSATEIVEQLDRGFKLQRISLAIMQECLTQYLTGSGKEPKRILLRE